MVPAAVSKDKDTPAKTAQLDRRDLLLGVLVGGQLLDLPTLQPAYADDVSGISKVWCACGVSPLQASLRQHLNALHCIRVRMAEGGERVCRGQCTTLQCTSCWSDCRCLWQGPRDGRAAVWCSS